jgi:hypothetical protein
MQTGAWIALLHQIPKSQHDNLVFTTTAGIEIVVQAVQRIEADYVLVRGRQTGVVAEGGGFFFIPYDRILVLGFQKAVKESVIRSIYGEQVAAEPAFEPAIEPAPTPPTAESAVVEEPPAPVPAPAATPVPAPPPESPKPNAANKAQLLERLRARRSETGSILVAAPNSIKP